MSSKTSVRLSRMSSKTPIRLSRMSSKSSVLLFVCGAKIILFIRIIVVSAYVFSIIN